jgi:putative endonuclease
MWQVYIIRCADDTLYTGITTDVPRRLSQHAANGGAAAKYLRGRAPLTLAFCCTVGSRSTALRVERRVKKLGKHDKERLVAGECSLAELKLL